MEIRDLTGFLKSTYTQGRTDIKSVHYGEADPQDVQMAYDNPRAFAKTAGVESGDESQCTPSRPRSDRIVTRTDFPRMRPPLSSRPDLRRDVP